MASGVRITFGGKSATLMYNLEKSYSKMMNYQEQLSTGKKLLRPSDNPINTINVLKVKTKEAMNNQFKRNLTDGKAYLYAYDDILQSSVNNLQRSRELAIQARSETLSGEQRGDIAKEIVQISRSLMHKANTLYKGDYIFSGTQTDKPPYELRNESGETLNVTAVGVPIQMGASYSPTTHNVIPTTLEVTDGATTKYKEGVDYTVDYVSGEITVLGTGSIGVGSNIDVSYESFAKSKFTNKEAIDRQISEGQKMKINMNSSDVFEDDNGNDILDTFVKFAEGLVKNDNSMIENSITDIDNMRGSILKDTATNGARINVIEDQEANLNKQDVGIASQLSEYEDIDYAKTISDFTMQQNLFQSSMQAAGKIITPFIGSYI